jgi:HK97 gp10 family phage protein
MAVSFFNIHAVRLNEMLADLDRLDASLNQDISFEMEACAINIVRKAKQRVSGDLGVLARDISYQRVSIFNFRIIAGAQYSAFAEFGTKRRTVIPAGFEDVAKPFKGIKIDTGGLTLEKAITLWGNRKGLEPDHIGAIYLSIARHGRRPHPFLIPAFIEETEALEDRIRNMLKK